MGCTPLHFASLYANTKGALVLIKLGADVNAANDRGSTPLHVRLGYVFKSSKGTGMDCLSSTLFPRDFITRTMEIILMLVSNGGDIYAENLNGCTPLSLVRDESLKANMLFFTRRSLLLFHEAVFLVDDLKNNESLQCVAGNIDLKRCIVTFL